VIDPTGILCFLLVIVPLVALVGHGIWLLAAYILRAIAGPVSQQPWQRSEPPARQDPVEAELRDLAVTERELRRLLHREALDPALFDQLMAAVRRRRADLGVPEHKPIHVPVPPKMPEPVISQTPAEEPLEVLPVAHPVEAALQPVKPPEPPPIVLPRPPRRTLGEVLSAFMEEHNILWGELAGGLLIVGCSVALVVYLWQTQKEIRYFPFFVVAGVTAALFGAGVYAERRWKLETTSRGLLIIAALLVPLSFLVLAGLSAGLSFGEEGDWSEIVTQLAAVGGFAWLVSLAGGVLTGAEQMPGGKTGRWLLAATVMISSGMQVLVPRVIEKENPALISFLILGVVTTVCHSLSTGIVLFRARGELQASHAHALFAFVGIATFPLLVALGFLIYWCSDPALALERTAALIAVAGVPALATGVLVHSSGLSGPLRAVGTSIALAGMLVLLAAMAMAWPQPPALIAVCAVNFVVLSVTAWRFRLPVAHAAALLCLAVGYLTAYHLVTGGLDVARAELGSQLVHLALTGSSGGALTALAVALAMSAEILVRLRRATDGVYHAAGAGILAAISLALVTADGMESPGRAALVYAICGVCGLLANGRWARPWLTYAGAFVCFCGIAYGLHWSSPDSRPERLGVVALLAHSAATLVGSLLLQWKYRSGIYAVETADPASQRYRVRQSFIIPLIVSALIASCFAPVALLAAMERNWLMSAAGYGCWLAVIWLVLAWNLRSPAIFSAFQVQIYAALTFAVTAWLDALGWIEKWPDDLGRFRSLHAYGICLAGLSLLFVITRLLLRTNPRAWRLLEPQWPAIDRVVISLLVLGLLGMAVVGISPGINAEWTPTAEYSSNFTAAATGPGAWALLGALVIVLGVALWDRLLSEAVLGLLFVGLTIPLLIAGAFADDRASASAIRWGLSVCFVVGSAAIWFRDSLARSAAGLGIKTDDTPWLAAAARVVLIGLMAAPALVLTAVVASLQMAGEQLGGPVAESFFARLGPLASALIPLVIIIVGMVGYAVREQAPGYAFAAGVIADLTLVGGYALGVVTAGGRMDETRSVFLVQLYTIGAAVWAGACLLSRRGFAAWREGPENPSAQPLMRLQLGMSALGNVYLVLLPILVPLFSAPQESLSDGQLQIGQAAGWLGLLASAAVMYWYVSGVGARAAGQTEGRHRVHVLGALGVGVVALAASGLNPTGEPWTSYHVLVAAGSVYALGILIAGMLAVQPHLLQSLVPAAPTESDESESRDWSKWLADLLPARAVQGWLHGINWPLVILALRGGWTDPERPYWSVAGLMTASVVTGALAVWSRRQVYAYASGLLANLVAILIWVAFGAPREASFVQALVLGLALASLIWSAIEIAMRRPPWKIGLDGRLWPFAHSALILALALLGIVVYVQVDDGWHAKIPSTDILLAWLGLAATAAACGILFWDARARFVWVGLYLTGLLAIFLALGDMRLSQDRFWWLIAASLGIYVLAMSTVRRFGHALAEFGRRIGVPDRAGGWPVDWFVMIQTGVGLIVLIHSIWIILTFDALSDRILGPVATAFLVPAAVLILRTAARRQTKIRYTALALGVVIAVETGWSLLSPERNAIWLHRNALLLVALAVMTAGYGVVLPRLLRPESEWLSCVRNMGPILAVLSAAQLLIVLGHEAALYDAEVRTTPLAWWGVLAVAIGFGLLAVAVLRFAVTPGRDPLGFSERGRTLYVYAAEMLVVLLLVHLRLNVPDLFPKFVGRYWPLVIMGIAFLGVGLSEWFDRIGTRVLSEPLRRTSVFLPILPLVAFWVRDWTGLREAAAQNVPALSPLLRYLDRLEGGFGLHASVWFILGMLYATVAVSRRSFKYAMLGAVAANFGLWVIFAHVEGMAFVAHPQLWLIPLSLILLVAEQLNRDKLSEAQATTLRYLALTVLYVSSTADMFIAGIGNSVMLPIILALLSVLGILVGILLRVRAFLFQGLTFLFVVVLTMIWHAAVQRGQTWVWYVSGIVLGAAILALFALFEKRRNDVVKVVQELKRWE
jgi:hypothetical protein